MKILNSPEGLHILKSIREVLKDHLALIDMSVGIDSSNELENLLNRFMSDREIYEHDSGEILNDITILETLVLFIRSYGRLWKDIAEGRYAASWLILQDANDSLRLIRRWSGLTLDLFSHQLSALESLYPYKIFASTGFVVGWYECSICGKDIDTFECDHRKGTLYRGKMAYAIGRDIRDLDHISFVENPVDKRCVFTIPDDAPGFSGVAYLADALRRRHFKISNFGEVVWRKIQLANPEYARIGRNELCHCGSGRKFKHCCIGKKFKECKHAEIVPVPSIFERCEL